MKGLGRPSRDTGQRRVPAPPERITGINMMVRRSWKLSRSRYRFCAAWRTSNRFVRMGVGIWRIPQPTPPRRIAPKVSEMKADGGRPIWLRSWSLLLLKLVFTLLPGVASRGRGQGTPFYNAQLRASWQAVQSGRNIQRAWPNLSQGRLADATGPRSYCVTALNDAAAVSTRGVPSRLVQTREAIDAHRS